MEDVLEKLPYRSTSIYVSCLAVTSSGHLIVTAAKEEVMRSLHRKDGPVGWVQ